MIVFSSTCCRRAGGRAGGRIVNHVICVACVCTHTASSERWFYGASERAHLAISSHTGGRVGGRVAGWVAGWQGGPGRTFAHNLVDARSVGLLVVKDVVFGNGLCAKQKGVREEGDVATWG